METELVKEINKVLKSFPQFWSAGKLHRSKVCQAIQSRQPDLIKALVGNDKIRETYSVDVDGILCFDFGSLEGILEYKEYWQDSFTKYRNKIGLTSEGRFLEYNSDVVLDFPFKDCVLEGGMTKEDKGKDEIYYNKIIAHDEIDRLFSPKVFTKARRYSEKGIEEGVSSFNENDNLIIKGNNLIALHSLKERYAGKVKLIYIDPPYNTGNDGFRYNDNFNHSSWLTFMKNRLEVAKELLRDDGVIFIQCDDNEQAYLKILSDNIFGLNNYLVTFYIQVRYANKSLNERDNFQKLIEQILVYSKNKSKFIPNKPYEIYSLDKFNKEIIEKSGGRLIELGNKSVRVFCDNEFEIVDHAEGNLGLLKETWASGSVLKGNNSGKFFDKYISKRKDIDGVGCLYKVEGIGDDGLGYRYFTGPKKENATKGKFYSGVPLERREEIKKGESKKYKPIINFYDYSADVGNIRTEGSVNFNAGKKPEKLIQKIIEITTKENELVLDFHLGSGTTAAVAHKMKRRYIGIEQMDYIEDITVPRLQKVIEGEQSGISKNIEWQGGGSFVYAEIMEFNAKFINDITLARSYDELEKIFDLLKEKAHLNYQVDLERVLSDQYDDDIAFRDLSLERQKNIMIDLLDDNQMYVSASEIDDTDLNISESDKLFTRNFYGKE